MNEHGQNKFMAYKVCSICAQMKQTKKQNQQQHPTATTTKHTNRMKKYQATAAVAVSEVSREFVLEFATSALHICCNNWHACIIATRT